MNKAIRPELSQVSMPEWRKRESRIRDQGNVFFSPDLEVLVYVSICQWLWTTILWCKEHECELALASLVDTVS